MKRTIVTVALADEAPLLKALTAYRAYKDAQLGGAPANEVRRLGLLAESLFDVVVDYQALLAGQSLSTI